MAAAASHGSENPSTYFRHTKPHWVVAIATGMTLYAWAVFSPETFPYSYLGPLGTVVKYMVTHHNGLFQLGFYVACLIHVAEAFYSVKIVKDKGITDRATQLKWFVQTLLFGIASLSYLLAYDPPKKSR